MADARAIFEASSESTFFGKIGGDSGDKVFVFGDDDEHSPAGAAASPAIVPPRVSSQTLTPHGAVATATSALSFAGFQEALLRCGGMLTSSSQRDNTQSAHLDVFFRSIDISNDIFFKSTSRHSSRPKDASSEFDDFLAVLNSEENNVGQDRLSFTFEDAIRVAVRLDIGDVGLISIYNKWTTMACGREVMGMDEITILTRQIFQERCRTHCLGSLDFHTYVVKKLPTGQ